MYTGRTPLAPGGGGFLCPWGSYRNARSAPQNLSSPADRETLVSGECRPPLQPPRTGCTEKMKRPGQQGTGVWTPGGCQKGGGILVEARRVGSRAGEDRPPTVGKGVLPHTRAGVSVPLTCELSWTSVRMGMLSSCFTAWRICTQASRPWSQRRESRLRWMQRRHMSWTIAPAGDAMPQDGVPSRRWHGPARHHEVLRACWLWVSQSTPLPLLHKARWAGTPAALC